MARNNVKLSTLFNKPYSIIEGDAREVLRDFPANSINLTVTSPPYFNLRNYTDGTEQENEIGTESTMNSYLDNLMELFDEVSRVTTKDGSCWVNIDDTIKGSPMMIPEKFVYLMQYDGWILMNKVVWYKVDAMAESCKRRFSRKYEMFYWFVKTKDYYFNENACNIPVSKATVERMKYGFNSAKSQAVSRMRGIVGDMSDKADEYLERGVNCGDIWALPTNKVKVEHAAPYPEALIARPIIACCPEGGIVLDPFSGSGTTVLAAKKLFRRGIGIELNPDSVKESRQRMKDFGDTLWNQY